MEKIACKPDSQHFSQEKWGNRFSNRYWPLFPKWRFLPVIQCRFSQKKKHDDFWKKKFTTTHYKSTTWHHWCDLKHCYNDPRSLLALSKLHLFIISVAFNASENIFCNGWWESCSLACPKLNVPSDQVPDEIMLNNNFTSILPVRMVNGTTNLAT